MPPAAKGRERERRIAVHPAMLVTAACPVLAAVSLLLPWDLSFDPWGWMLWGRELTSGSLAFSTSLYPSWKPLPVMLTTAFAPLGDAAPDLWLLVARASALLAVVLGYRLGARLGGRVAGVAAAAGVLLLPESLRYFAGGASEPMLLVAVLAAIDRHLAGRGGQALALGFAAALLRPEAWPFLVAYAVFYSWGRPRRALVAVVLLAALTVLWFVPEWIGAGDPFYGSWLARVSKEARDTQSLHSPELAALGRALGLVLVPLGLGAIVAVISAARRRQLVPLVLAAGAVGWVAIVVAMTALGYAGLGRFSLPAAAVVCVLGGAGVARLVESAPGRRRALALGAAVLVSVPFVAARVDHIAAAASVATAHDKLEDRFPAVVDRIGGPASVRACGRFTVDGLFRTAIGWRLQVTIKALTRKRPLLVFRTIDRVIPGFEGPMRLAKLWPARPFRRIARLAGWDVVASTARRRCRRALLSAAGSRAQAPAGLRELARHGCLTSGTAPGCDRARALRRASWVTISPDGRNVYVGAERSNAVAAFSRHARTGVLSQLPGRAGCSSEQARDGCAAGRGLHAARPIALSGDGRNLYAGTLDGVAVFGRNRRTGALHQLAGARGCVADRSIDGCAQGRGLLNVRALAVAPGGRYLYVAARGSDAVAMFARSPRSGALRQLPGVAGCVSEGPIAGCSRGRGLDGGRGVVFSPDRRFVYVTAEDGDSLAVFARDRRNGGLRQLPGQAGCLQRLGADGCAPLATLRSPHHLILSSDGRFAYVAADTSGAVVVLRRGGHTGRLVPVPGRRGCIESPPWPGCIPGRALGGAHSLALAPDGRVLYAVGRRDYAIAVLARNPVTGALSQRGCVGRSRVPACAPARGLRGVHSVAASADGRHVYAASELADSVVALATPPP